MYYHINLNHHPPPFQAIYTDETLRNYPRSVESGRHFQSCSCLALIQGLMLNSSINSLRKKAISSCVCVCVCAWDWKWKRMCVRPLRVPFRCHWLNHRKQWTIRYLCIFCLASCLMLLIRHRISFPISQMTGWNAECVAANVKRSTKKRQLYLCVRINNNWK